MAMLGAEKPLRPLLWIESSRRDYAEFPDEAQEEFGFHLYLAQAGEHPPSAKPLRGLGGVIELAGEFDGDAYRAVYTVRFKEAIYVLHAFKKKSKRGIATPRSEIELIRHRLRFAERDHATRFPK